MNKKNVSENQIIASLRDLGKELGNPGRENLKAAIAASSLHPAQAPVTASRLIRYRMQGWRRMIVAVPAGIFLFLAIAWISSQPALNRDPNLSMWWDQALAMETQEIKLDPREEDLFSAAAQEEESIISSLNKLLLHE